MRGNVCQPQEVQKEMLALRLFYKLRNADVHSLRQFIYGGFPGVIYVR